MRTNGWNDNFSLARKVEFHPGRLRNGSQIHATLRVMQQ